MIWSNIQRGVNLEQKHVKQDAEGRCGNFKTERILDRPFWTTTLLFLAEMSQ